MRGEEGCEARSRLQGYEGRAADNDIPAGESEGRKGVRPGQGFKAMRAGLLTTTYLRVSECKGRRGAMGGVRPVQGLKAMKAGLLTTTYLLVDEQLRVQERQA